MRHAHSGSRSLRVHVAGGCDAHAERRPAIGHDAACHHTLLDDRGRQIGRITNTPIQPEFGRLEPTLLLRRDDVSLTSDDGTDQASPTAETGECTP